MDTDKINISLSPRDNWQAFDLGSKLAINWWKSLYGFWFLAAFPVFLLAMLISPVWGIILVWWLKPLFEVGLLHILSRNIFQQETSVRDTFKVFFRLLRPTILPALTWRRLSFSRGFNLAVVQLEGLSGEKRTRRLNVLHRRNPGIHWWLIICAHLEMIILTGLLTLIMMMTPEGNSFFIFDYILEETDGSYLVSNIVTFISMWLIAPIFQAGSFIAYLNRRVILEGWDIEIQFKSIAKALQKMAKATSSVILVLVAITVSELPGNAAWASGTMAENSQQQTAQDSAAEEYTEQDEGETQLTEEELALKLETEKWAAEIKTRLELQLTNEPFSEEVTTYDLDWTGWETEDRDTDNDNTNLSGLMLFIATIAQFAEVIFWLIFGGLLALTLWLTRHHIARLFGGKANSDATKTDTVIPDFIVNESSDSAQTINYESAIIEAITEQNWRLCLSLMLISSLKVIQGLYPLELHRSNTEKECLNKILQFSSEQEADYFQRLFSIWTQIAWSHNQADSQQIEQLYEHWKSFIPQRLEK